MIKTGVILVLFFGFQYCAKAQSGFEKVYGGAFPEMFRDVQKTADEHLIAAGNTQSYGSGAVNSPDFYVVKMTYNGDTLWTRSFGTSSPEDAYAITELNDGYVIAGYALNPLTNTYDFYAVKTDVNGNHIWDNYYGGSGGDYSASAITISGNRLLMAGSTTSVTYGSYDFYLVETDSNGTQIADTHYGGVATDILKKVIASNDGGYLMVGYSNSFTPTYDVYVVKADSNLSEQWSKTFSSPATDYGYDAVQDAAGNFFILANQPGAPDSGLIKLIKTDASGLNAITYPIGAHAGDYAFGLEAIENAFLITGFTFSPSKGSEFLLIKTDLNGDTIWSNHYGSTKNEVAFSIVSADNGNIIIAGETEGFGVDNIDAYIIQVDTSGEIVCPDQVSFTASENLLCEDQTVFLTNTTVSSSSFNWMLEGAVFSQEINAAYYFSESGIFDISLSSCSAESSAIFEIFSKPPSHFTYSTAGTAVSFLLPNSFNPDSFTWDYGDGSVLNSTVLNPLHEYSNQGNYWVSFSAIDLNGCDSSYTSQISVVTGVEDQELENSIMKLMPNPMHEEGILVVSGNLHFPVQAIIYDLAGRMLLEFPVYQKIQKFSVESFNQGSYLLVLKSDSGILSVVKLIIE